MSPHSYSEDKLIEQTSMQLFKEKLGWEIFNAMHEQEADLGRKSEREVLLKRRFEAALRSLNPGLVDAAYENAWELIAAGNATQQLVETNKEKYDLLRDGIPVTYKNKKGKLVRDQKLRVFDFENPENNDFLAVQQMWIKGRSDRRRRPDIIGFVNGIPLLFVELKAHYRKLRAAYNENFSDYKDVIPQLFHCNAFVFLSNGLESKVGSISSKFSHFHEWKRINEEDEGIVSLDIALRGLCGKQSFMDLFENFILYDSSDGLTKLIARNHQFLGVNKAYGHFCEQEEQFRLGKISLEEKQKLGVFWHTQGSGKSYSMAFLCQKILRKQGGYTFLLVTDRTELDKQIYGTFSGVGAVKDESSCAKSGKQLKELLKTDNRYIFSLIHKFNFDEVITDRDNIIVISDEAHRTQGGTLALNMRNAIPKASFMGFTGTPLFKDDELTRRIFGDYVSVYNFKRSIDDGATVPLYYENRGEKLNLDNPEINQQIREAIELTNLDSDQEDKLKRLFSREYPILTAEKRLRSIAKDIVWHFNQRGYKGKAMLVCLDKLTAVKMYGFIKEEWQHYLFAKEASIEKLDDAQEALIAKREWKWSKETEICVVVSEEQNEIGKFRDWGLDIEDHRAKMRTRNLETEFKDEAHPFRLAIVCAMWITGFDVKSLSTLYLDKPMRAHTLMQTIARANRVHEGKNNGLIVDYIETYKNLLEALAVYAIGGSKSGGSDSESMDVPVKPLEELVEDLGESIKAVVVFLRDELGFELRTVIESEGLDRLAAIQRGVNAVYTNDESKAKFGVMAREAFKKFKAVMPDKAINDFRERRDAIDSIYRVIQEQTDEADVSGLMKQIQDVVDQSVESFATAEPSSDYGIKVDLSNLDFDLVQKHFSKTENKNTTFQTLRQRVEQKLGRMVDQNPLRVDFYEKYNEIIDDYNLGKERVVIEQVFQDLIAFIQDLNEEDARAQREGLKQEHLAIFDLLLLDKQLSTKEKSNVKEIARELLDSLLENQLKVNQWLRKPQTAAAVKKVVNDLLFEKLPFPTYSEVDIDLKSEKVFQHLKSVFGDVA